MSNFSWSLSAWSLFNRCKFAYKCRYILQLKDSRPPAPAAQRGIETHKIIEEHIDKGHPLTPELGKWQYAFNQLRSESIALWPEYKISLTAEWTPTTWDKAWIKMIIDLMADKPSGVSVYDWKTGKEYDEHFEQKELYSIGIMSKRPEVQEVSAVHVYLDLGKQTKRVYHRSQLSARRAQWDFRAKTMELRVSEGPNSGFWIQEPNFSCRWCAFSKASGGPCKF